MVKVTHINPDVDATYHLTINKGTDKERKIAWCHPRKLEALQATHGDVLGYDYAVEHDIPQAEVERMAVPIRGNNLAVAEPKKKKAE